MAVRDGGTEAFSPGRSAVGTGHIGGCPSLVDEDEALGVEVELPFEPGLAPPQDVRAVLLGRVRALFFTVIPCRSKKRHSPP